MYPPIWTYLEPWINAFFEYDWKRAFPAPEVAIKQIGQLLEMAE